jgi:hypothetical protein
MELFKPISTFENTDLWKYMDFHRFASLVFTKQLVFTRLDKFPDPMEGLKREYLWNCLSSDHTPDDPSKLNPDLSEDCRNQIIDKKKSFESNRIEEKEKSQKAQFASCWFLGNRESMAMWNIYSKKSGIVIKSKANELICFISKALRVHEDCYPGHMSFAGDIDYLKINPFDPNDLTPTKKIPGFKKDLAFQFEHEFRFLIGVPYNKKHSYEIIKLDLIEIEDFDFEIITHPLMEEWQFQNIYTLAKQAFPKGQVKKSLISLKNDR